MKGGLMAAVVTLVLFLPSAAPRGLALVAVAEAQASEALVLKCRKAVFRKYGHRQVRSDGRRVRTLRKNFVLNQVDNCVANGGRVL